jgi:hypothetical protein
MRGIVTAAYVSARRGRQCLPGRRYPSMISCVRANRAGFDLPRGAFVCSVETVGPK